MSKCSGCGSVPQPQALAMSLPPEPWLPSGVKRCPDYCQTLQGHAFSALAAVAPCNFDLFIEMSTLTLFHHLQTDRSKTDSFLSLITPKWHSRNWPPLSQRATAMWADSTDLVPPISISFSHCGFWSSPTFSLGVEPMTSLPVETVPSFYFINL